MAISSQSCNILALRQKRQSRSDCEHSCPCYFASVFLSASWYPNSECFGSGLRALVLTLIIGLDSVDNNFYSQRAIGWITELALAHACRAFGSQFR